MEQEKIGSLISQLRKEKHLTQKELAAQLNVTDKAVSKWERGLCYPDISLLAPLADALGISVVELLQGERGCPDQAPERIADSAMVYAEKAVGEKARSLRRFAAAGFTALLLLGGIVCAVCNIAISHTLTWAWYPICSIVLAWCVGYPVLRRGWHGVAWALFALSVLILPYLYVLERLCGYAVLPIGAPMALLGLGFLWGLFAVWRQCRRRKFRMVGWSFLLTAALNLAANLVLSRLLETAAFDPWNLMETVALLAGAVGCFQFDRMRR